MGTPTTDATANSRCGHSAGGHARIASWPEVARAAAGEISTTSYLHDEGRLPLRLRRGRMADPCSGIFAETIEIAKHSAHVGRSWRDRTATVCAQLDLRALSRAGPRPLRGARPLRLSAPRADTQRTRHRARRGGPAGGEGASRTAAGG